MNSELHFLSARQLTQLIKEKKVSCVEVIQAHLARIKKINPILNAIIQALDPEKALKSLNDEKVNIVDNTNYVTNAEIDKDLSKEEKTDELNNNVFDNQEQENLINNITKDQEEQPGNIFKPDLEESILNGKKINNNDKNFKNVKGGRIRGFS